ncbi:hypothetical protein [Bosea sp. Root381]|uniref:hypothetical protein n=1 Tax=Bosea sp. Root381 TaxID=1736524 RepID=UPI0006F6DD13|nr:hypothetical protein [Bosea sp. Root381]
MQHSLSNDDVPAPSWRQRPRPVGFELSYRLEGDTLVIDSTRKVERIRLEAVEQIRFIHAPSNVSSKGFRTQLRLSDGRSFSFGNLSWRSLTDMERNDRGYHAFVSALAAAIARANPRARFIAGKPKSIWFALVTVSGLALLMLAYFILRALLQGAHSSALLGLLLGAFSLWQVKPMVVLNRPRELASGEVPDALVPGRLTA